MRDVVNPTVPKIKKKMSLFLSLDGMNVKTLLARGGEIISEDSTESKR